MSGVGSVVLLLTAEPPPVLHEFTAELGDAAWADAVFAGHVQGSLVLHQVFDDATVAVAESVESSGEIETEADLFRDGGERVIL